jgi:hypothetical protein
MKFFARLAVFVCGACLFAQSEDPAISQAKASIEKLRTLVQAGAVPRAQLEKAEDQLADAEDVAYLRRSLYGQELTEDQSDEMIAAANRRLDRRKKAFEDAKKLVDAGVAAESSLANLSLDIESSKKEVELAGARANLTHELAEMAKAEEALQTKLAEAPSEAPAIAERYDGNGVFSPGAFAHVEKDYEKEFGKALPVSAMGETAVHRALGFDHTGRVDIAVNPDQPEGVWLREYLTTNHIPFFAFRHAVPGKATGAHIHIGPGSTRLKLGG